MACSPFEFSTLITASATPFSLHIPHLREPSNYASTCSMNSSQAFCTVDIYILLQASITTISYLSFLALYTSDSTHPASLLRHTPHHLKPMNHHHHSFSCLHITTPFTLSLHTTPSHFTHYTPPLNTFTLLSFFSCLKIVPVWCLLKRLLLLVCILLKDHVVVL